MVSDYKLKHSHMPHARAVDRDLYYKIVLFTLFGFNISEIATLNPHTTPQTIARNFSKIRDKLAYNENYRIEVFNRFYHADPQTGNIYGLWRDRIIDLFEKDGIAVKEKQSAQIASCLRDCPQGEGAAQFVKKYIQVGIYNSTEIPEVFEPHTYPIPLVMPVLQHINGYRKYMVKKSSCKACPLQKDRKTELIKIFSDSPYCYIDLKYHFSKFQVRNNQDIPSHLFYAWISGCMRVFTI